MKKLIAIVFLFAVVLAKAANPTFPDMINFVNQVTNKNYVDVRLFGAVPDNVTPSDVAFRMAYTNALALNQPIFIQGQYYLTNTFVITNRGMSFLSFANPNDFTTGPNGLPDVCVHFGPSAVDGFVFTELNAGAQSDDGSFRNISVFMESTNGAGFSFASTNGTSDGIKFDSVAVKSGTIAFAGGIGFNGRFGISEGYFNNIYTVNCRVGFMITNEVGGGLPAGINQGDYILMNSENCNTVMETHSLQNPVIIFNHVSTLGTLLSFEATGGSVFCGHIENRSQGRAILRSIGNGGSSITFYGGIEDSDNTWCFEAADSGSTASLFAFKNFTWGGHTNISGSVDYVKLNHPDVQFLNIDGPGVRAALYNGASLLSSNAPGAFRPTWNPPLLNWPNNPNGYIERDQSTMPETIYINRQTNYPGINYERLKITQYDDDVRNKVVPLTTVSNNWTATQRFATTFGNAIEAVLDNGINAVFTSQNGYGGVILIPGGFSGYRIGMFPSWFGQDDVGLYTGNARDADPSGATTTSRPFVYFNAANNQMFLAYTNQRSGSAPTGSKSVNVKGLQVDTVKSSGAAPVAVTVGASPFTFLNATTDNLDVWLDDGAALYSMSLNGVAVRSSLAGATVFKLSPTNSIVITYPVTAPTALTNKW